MTLWVLLASGEDFGPFFSLLRFLWNIWFPVQHIIAGKLTFASSWSWWATQWLQVANVLWLQNSKLSPSTAVFQICYEMFLLRRWGWFSPNVAWNNSTLVSRGNCSRIIFACSDAVLQTPVILPCSPGSPTNTNAFFWALHDLLLENMAFCIHLFFVGE